MNLPKNVAAILDRLEDAGFKAYLVGGCVRDYLMGKEPHDFDITTSALPEQTKKLFADLRVEETGLQHGTVTVFLDHQPIEITTFRKEDTYSDHRHPDGVVFTRSVEEDLARRDFTMNAIACSKSGELVDPFGGRDDIKAGIIRCVGCARERFSEDALRILRALRFAARFGFPMEQETKAALFAQKELLRLIAVERIFSELKELMQVPYAEQVLMEFRAVIEVVIPAISVLTREEYQHGVQGLSQLPCTLHLRFAAYFYALPDEAAKEALCALRASNLLQKDTLILLRERGIALAPERIAVRRALCRMGEALFFDYLALRAVMEERQDEHEAIARELLQEGVCFSIAELAIGGRELLEIGLLGPAIGKMQKQLFEEVTAETLLNEKEALLARAREINRKNS